MQLCSHNLVWALDQCIPNWLIEQESTITPNKAKQLLSDYIHAVIGRYRYEIQLSYQYKI
jgi:GH35 family endo-1,4-beta-xylanase